MGSSFRPVTLVDAEGDRIHASNLIGLDESRVSESGTNGYAVTAVRCERDADVHLVRSLIDNDLQPFEHKSSTLLRYGHVGKNERRRQVEEFLSDLAETSISWATVVCRSEFTQGDRAAAAAMAAKKSITNPLTQGDLSPPCDDTALLHDGRETAHSTYYSALRSQAASTFEPSFQRSICPVHLTFMIDADRTYPPTNAADYISGYICDRLASGESITDFNYEQVLSFDPSWVDPAPQPAPVYRLEDLQPVREAALRSRIIAWLLGKGIPPDPSPTTRDPYQSLVDQIDDDVVQTYLRGF